MHVHRYATGIVMSLLVLRCAPRASRTEGTVVVRGRVVDATSSKPIRGARITDADVTTAASADSLGVFTLRTQRPEEGRFHLLVRAIGYKPGVVDTALVADSIQDLGTISLQQDQVHLDDFIVNSPSRKPH